MGYQMISKQSALLNDVPQGAYVVNVVSGSSAENAGIKKDDIIVSINGEKVADFENGLSDVIKDKKVGDKVEIELDRDGETVKVNATLSETSE